MHEMDGWTKTTKNMMGGKGITLYNSKKKAHNFNSFALQKKNTSHSMGRGGGGIEKNGGLKVYFYNCYCPDSFFINIIQNQKKILICKLFKSIHTQKGAFRFFYFF